jgi:hypothetical protein
LNANYVPEGDYIARHGGAIGLSCQLARLVTNIARTALALTTYLSDGSFGSACVIGAGVSKKIWMFGVYVAHVFQVYSTVLSSVVLAKPVSQSRRFSIHATITSFSLFACYLYRDVWPLLTFTLSPTDGSDPIAWASLVLAGVTGFVLPICEPYPYIPYDPSAPQEQVNPEQTASLLSIVLWTVMDPVIFKSTRVAHLSADMLPPAIDTDGLEALKPRAYPFLDPFYRSETRDGKPRRVRVFLGLLAALRSIYGLQAFLYTISPIIQLGAPIGTNRLLAYLEADGADAVVRPWVWIIWIGAAPFIWVLVEQINMWLIGRVFAQVEAIIIALVYDHALRVRIIHHTVDLDAGLPGVHNAGTTSATAEADDSASAPTAAAETPSRPESRATTDTAVASPSGSSKGVDSGKKKAKKEEKTKAPTKDMIGRLNNLVTSGE